jgi:hypothetical protein
MGASPVVDLAVLELQSSDVRSRRRGPQSWLSRAPTIKDGYPGVEWLKLMSGKERRHAPERLKAHCGGIGLGRSA